MGTGYTRNDSANNIADGNVINASDLDGEFDAVQAAFNGTTGHSHDGTTGEGPQIAAGGIASNAVTTAKILDANVTTDKIANSNVTLAKMAANSIDSDQYVDGSIDTAHIGNLQVTTAKIAADAIDGTKLADNAVDSEHYTDGSIDRVHLAADIVDGTKIADDSIDSEHYVDGSIDTAHIANDAVTLGTKTSGNYVATGAVSGVGLSGSASAEGATFTVTSNATNANTASTIVARDASGNFSAGNVTVGNLITAGNVDGRDVSADGSKLDGIESGATADQSASEILTLIKTVDGSGSGLDADALDGIGSSSFLRSDAEDTKTSGALNFSDNVLARFGAGNDLQIYHDGSNSYINDVGTGNLRIRATNFQLQDSAGYSYIEMSDNGTGGTVELKNNASTKLTTKSDGVDITGELQSDSLDVDGNADISGTLTMGGNIDLQDNDKILLGSSDDLEIFHDALNSYIVDIGTGNLNIRGTHVQIQDSSGNNFIYCNDTGTGGTVNLYQNASLKLNTATDGIYVTGNVQSSTGYFEGANPNDRIQINTNTIDFYIDASNEFRFEADGDFHADGDVIAFSTTISDERLKTDIEKIENATDKVSQLNGYTFTYKADGKKSAGVIAQEVEKVLPSAVSEKELPLKTDDGVAYKTVQYDQIIGLLIESIKELKQEINDLKKD